MLNQEGKRRFLWYDKITIKGIAVFMSLLVALIISVTVSYLVIFNINEKIHESLYELYMVYIVVGFLSTWLIILAVLRYTLSKRHCS
jgi:preprotein translocase subunit SecF